MMGKQLQVLSFSETCVNGNWSVFCDELTSFQWEKYCRRNKSTKTGEFFDEGCKQRDRMSTWSRRAYNRTFATRFYLC